MVFSGKVYETDGSQAVGVYEAADVRPLAPIRQATSLRLFSNEIQGPIEERNDPLFVYGNPRALFGPSQFLPYPTTSIEVSFKPYVAAILVSDAYQLDLEEADDVVLGYTLVNLMVAQDLERVEKRQGGGFGGSHDIGGAIGPVITTPDELNDDLESEEQGRRYRLTVVARVNGVEVARGQLADLPYTFAQAISTASQTTPLHEGDVICLGPIIEWDEPVLVNRGDEVQISVEKLGALTLRIAEEE